MIDLPGRMANAGLGVNRGRFPGPSADACPRTAQLCEPRADGQSPVPGITGDSNVTSDGLDENALPYLSTTAT